MNFHTLIRVRVFFPLVASVTVGTIALAGCASPVAGNQTGGTLTVEAFNPFTGPDAAFGPEMMAGCEAAVTAINAAGGVQGNKLNCASTDTRGDPADAVTGATRMIAATSGLFGVLGPSSDEADATVPLINAAKVPMFADTGEASFDHTTLPFFWRLTPADDVKGYAMALYAMRKGYTRAAVVFGNDISSQSNLPTLLRAYGQLGGNMVITQKIALGQSSYRSEVEQLIAARPQVIFTEASPQANATYLSELKQLGTLVPVIGTDATIQSDWLSAVAGAIGKDSLSRIFVAEQPYAPTTGPSWETFNKNLLASAKVSKPDQWSSDSYTMGNYDAVTIMALAATAAKSVDPSAFNASITAVTTQSTPGAKVVHSYAEGVAALKAGDTIAYVGAAGVIDFNSWHNSSGGFEIAAYQLDGSLKLVDSVSANQIAASIK